MGYEISTVNSTAYIPQKHLEKAYEVACELNKHDELKNGGTSTLAHFSWMDANYPEKCKDIEAILNELGFETEEDEKGNLRILFYNNKAGDEEVFFKALAPYVKGEIEWQEEEGDRWRWTFENGKLVTKRGRTVYD